MIVTGTPPVGTSTCCSGVAEPSGGSLPSSQRANRGASSSRTQPLLRLRWSLICCVDGLKGFPEAIEAIFPRTTVQTCVVHLIRASLRYVPRREREQVARDLKPIYTATDADAAHAELEAFDEKWGTRFPPITQAWLNAWEYVIPFLSFPAEVRRVIYTTNAIEALNRQLRKAIKTKGSFPNEDAARKLVYLALQNATPQWTRPATGRPRCSRSRSTSVIASRTLQTDSHTLTLAE